MDSEFWKTPPDMNCFTPTDYDFDLRLCKITYFSNCALFVVLLPLNVYLFMLNCIHYNFTLIDFCTSYFLTYTVKVFFSLNSTQTFFLHVKLNVSFVHLFTGILYPKTIIALRAFKSRAFFTYTLNLSYDIFHEHFSSTLRAFKCHFFTCISCYILIYRYVFVCKT